MSAKGQGRPGAPLGNTNRAIPQEQRKRGKTAIMSMPNAEWEMFKAACDVSEGAALTDEEYIKIWRTIDQLARKAFIERHHANGDPAIIV